VLATPILLLIRLDSL